MSTCSITVSVALSDALPQEWDIQIFAGGDGDGKADIARHEVDVRVSAGDDGDSPAIVTVPSPHASAKSREFERQHDDYVLGGYAGI